MGHSTKQVVLAHVVATFRNALPPDEQEAFNECLLHIYMDPDGTKTHRSIQRVRPPLVYYFHGHNGGQFGLYYFIKREASNPTHMQIEVFAADYLQP